MLGWSAQTTVIAMLLAAIAILASRSARLGPAARHVLWLVVLIKLVTPPVVNWPWSPSGLWATARPVPIAHPILIPQRVTALAYRERETDKEPARPTGAIPTGAISPGAMPTGAISAPQISWNVDILKQGLFGLWLGISAMIALWQVGRIVRFHRRLGWAIPAPEWLVADVRHVSSQLGVRAPQILVLPDLAPPMLWFLGRAKLLLPGRLVSHADLPGLRAILAHELAHLRRGDHWVRRLDFFASLIWWWNPVYWLTRERLGAEAELACDEWAIRTVPDGRVSYAEALLEVCRTLSTTRSPAPALGVAGAGRFLERRVNMILQNHTPSRISVPVLVGAGLLALLALPGWSAAGAPPPKSSDPPMSAPKTNEHLLASATDAGAVVADDDDDEDKNVDAKKAEIAKELKKELGPGSEFQKEMKNLGEELKKELGPGSDFEKEMKGLGKTLQKELGPGSEFEKAMKNLGEELSKQLGPGSDFERKMERLGKDTEARFGEGSEFAKKMKQATADAKAAKASSDPFSEKKAKAKKQAESSRRKASAAKAREVKALKMQVDKLNAEIKKLQAADADDDEKE